MSLTGLEIRKHRILIGGMLLLGLLWASWMARFLLSQDSLTAVAIDVGSVLALSPVGLLVPIVLARALSGEAAGPLAFLLTSPRSGFAHIAARFGVATTTLAVYYAILTGISAWVASSAGIQYDAWLPWATWAYVMAAWVAPVVILGIVYGLVVAAYRPGRAGQVVAVASVFGVIKIWGWLTQWLAGLDLLPQIPIPRLSIPPKVAPYLGLPVGSIDLKSELQEIFGGIPTEPVLVGLLLTVILFWIATRLWEEVEWA